ncbi:hypothetical protein Tco_1153947 [Tanacetum coccineum]
MSTQQDIYAAGSENRPPMLNKDNYVTMVISLVSVMLRVDKFYVLKRLMNKLAINSQKLKLNKWKAEIINSGPTSRSS